jgi:hypothetical protein
MAGVRAIPAHDPKKAETALSEKIMLKQKVRR